MRENLVQRPVKGADGRSYIANDWYPNGIPSNVSLAENVYMDTSYGFAGFRSEMPGGLVMEEGSGLYEIVTFNVSPRGKIRVGKFSIVNGATLTCNHSITIGDHCMIAWGATLTDSWLDAAASSLAARQELLYQSAANASRPYPFAGPSLPVVLEDNCWVGFDAVILPGVRLGRGCLIGCKTVVSFDVPPYAVVAGSPAKIVKYLTPNDTDEYKEEVLRRVIG
jgi:acetyltransferase-like isoleucine patch superfamily enzyme